MVCFSVIGTQRKVPRSMQTENVKQVCSEFEKAKKHQKLY